MACGIGIVRGRVEAAVRRAPPGAQRRNARSAGDDDQPLHQVRHQVDFVGRFRTQVHDEVGTSQRQRANARACARDFVAGMIAARCFERGHDLHGACGDAALAFKARQQRIGFRDFADRLRTGHDDAGEARMHACIEIVVQRGRIDLRENFSARAARRLQRGSKVGRADSRSASTTNSARSSTITSAPDFAARAIRSGLDTGTTSHDLRALPLICGGREAYFPRESRGVVERHVVIGALDSANSTCGARFCTSATISGVMRWLRPPLTSSAGTLMWFQCGRPSTLSRTA